jgi:SAM-dependent methyltransferase
LVLAWNFAHQAFWYCRDRAVAIAHGRWQICEVCGRRSLMLYRRRVIPLRLVEMWGLKPRVARALAQKESLDCASCGAKLRARRLAQSILKHVSPGGSGPLPRSLHDWARLPQSRTLSIAEINLIDGLHAQLATLPGLVFSDYRDENALEANAEGVACEDLTHLSYADARFDLVLTSETLEHVPDLQTALAEIHRVLKCGGVHIFTIPLLPDVEFTFERATLLPDGRIKPRNGPLLHHPGGDVGYPVFTEFGGDAARLFHEAGFDTEIDFGPVCEDDLAQVFVCRKRVEPGG